MVDILLIDKPSGITSFDCIRILRKKLGIRKMGHAGTLDPMATGLMIIGVGGGTKRLHEFLKLPKTYEAEILLGIRTDTGDVTGEVLEESEVDGQGLHVTRLSEVLTGMVGKLELPVPAYSAIKQGGEALYKKARRGEFVNVPVKTMEINSVEFLEVEPQVGKEVQPLGNHRLIRKARFTVTSGTYIRSLAEEFGRRLGVPATLTALRRTRIGNFCVEDAEIINPRSE